LTERRVRIAGWKPEQLAQAFARNGRLHVPDFLEGADAEAVGRALARDTPWRRGVNQGERSWDLPVEELEGLPEAERARLNQLAWKAAEQGFQYLFDTYRISDEVEAGRDPGPVFGALYRFLNGGAFLGFVRTLTDDDRPRYCDAQATRYLPGQFLTEHDDDVAGKGRLYAYVLNFTPLWRPDWGGLLLFLDADGHVGEGYTPAFNALNIFRVPQRHAVSIVAPFARGPRLSITGWVRA
jgi:Rps23 Pro-64 3,4-dihydroxylase Tpa1-like proline 4-hydroxylase